MLLILQGGAGNANGSEALANALADRFTVITYDRRGLSRSKPTQAEGCEIVTHAANLAQLIGALSLEPVFVFGSSIGALIGVALAADDGKRVRMLVAHEPPVYRLLQGDEQEEALRSHIELHQTFQQEESLIFLRCSPASEEAKRSLGPGVSMDPAHRVHSNAATL